MQSRSTNAAREYTTMRKTSFILGLALTVGAAGAASAQSGTKPQRSEKPRAEQGRGGQRGERGELRGRRDGFGPAGALLKGITLSDAQKAQLKTIREQNKPSDAQREQGRTAFEEARAARQKGDTAAARVALAKVRADREKESARHLTALRAILTSEQQKQFDANVAEWKQRESQRPARGEGRGQRGGDRGGRRGARQG
jgi:Spy/CpxP family protein refolding chaperone